VERGPHPPPEEPLAGAGRAPLRWDEVDHALNRRALLRGLATGRASTTDACDASPFLQRAAREWGLRTERPCPVCRRERLWEIAWVYGDALGDASGTARSARGVALLARARPELAVYELEVCQGCGWNHLLRTYRTGTPGTSPASRSRERAR
jgi:hypothetical protein